MPSAGKNGNKDHSRNHAASVFQSYFVGQSNFSVQQTGYNIQLFNSASAYRQNAFANRRARTSALYAG
jgi:hypothetical protein